MAKQQKCPDCPPAAPAWLTTFSDLMSLLLTFFILLLSFSTINQEDFQNALGALQGALGVLDGEPILTSPIKLNVPIVKGDINEARPTIKDAASEIEREVKSEGQEENIEVIQTSEGITIRIRDRVLFASGKAEINVELLPLLTRIGGVLNRMPNRIEVEGHTDNVPISNEEFPNNFWLSNARALKVLDLLADDAGIARSRLSATGYGEYRPLPDVPNDTPEHRARNRRVEIKVRFEQNEKEAKPEQVRQWLNAEGLGGERSEENNGAPGQ